MAQGALCIFRRVASVMFRAVSQRTRCSCPAVPDAQHAARCRCAVRAHLSALTSGVSCGLSCVLSVCISRKSACLSFMSTMPNFS